MTEETPSKRFSVKILVYAAIMAALGTALAILSIELLPLAQVQITLDLSHIGTFLTAIPGGPIGQIRVFRRTRRMF